VAKLDQHAYMLLPRMQRQLDSATVLYHVCLLILCSCVYCARRHLSLELLISWGLVWLHPNNETVAIGSSVNPDKHCRATNHAHSLIHVRWRLNREPLAMFTLQRVFKRPVFNPQNADRGLSVPFLVFTQHFVATPFVHHYINLISSYFALFPSV